MGLFSSLFSRSESAADAAAETDSSDNVARARSRARQRLLGAVVLVGIGIIGFPLLFETQPRPIPVDVPIEIPARDNVAPLKLPGAKDGRSASETGSADKATAAKSEPIITETAADAGSPVAADKPIGSGDQPTSPPAERAVEKAAEKPAERVAEKTAEKVAEKAADKPSDKAADKATGKAVDRAADKPVDRAPELKAAEAARARALLEGKVAPKEAPGSARFIVQIGAFADPSLARATRQKVERLGLVTYTNVAKTPDGERTRVRVGPVSSRAEAEKIASKIKAAGLPTAILTL